jgi:lipooligosaccharide transport system permease protein
MVLLHFWEHQLWRLRSSFRATIVYLLGIGIGIGSQVDTGAAGLGTDRYLDYVGPGLMAAAAMQLGSVESLWSTGASLKWQGNYISAIATPLGIGQLFVGHVVWIGFRAFVGATVYLVALFVFGIPTQLTTALAPLAAALTATAFASPISAWTGWVTSGGQSDQSFPMILRLFVLPMYLFSGAFYPIDQLPLVLEWVSRVLPVWHGVELVRGLTIDTGLTASAAAGHTLLLLTYTVVGMAFGARTFTKALGT